MSAGGLTASEARAAVILKFRVKIPAVLRCAHENIQVAQAA